MKKILFSFLVLISMTLVLASNCMAAEIREINAVDCVPDSKYAFVLSNGKAISMNSGHKAGYDFDFEESPTSIYVTVGTGPSTAGGFEIHLDKADGKLLGYVNVKEIFTESKWSTVTANVPITEKITGKHTLWFVFKSGTHDFHGFKLSIPGGGNEWASFKLEDAYSNIEEHPLRQEINLMSQLGIIEAVPNGNYSGELVVTRRDLVKMLAGFYDDSVITVSGKLFADISSSDPDYNAFAKLCSVGVIKSQPGKKYNPVSMIKLSEACELCCRVLDCDYLSSAGKSYVEIARSFGLTRGISGKAYMTRDDIMYLISNMLSANYMEISAIGNDYVRYEAYNPSILYKTRDIYTASGLVSANGSYDLYTNEPAKSGTVIIDNVSYNVGDSFAMNFVGFNCTYYYTVKNDIRTIIAIAPHADTEWVTISAKDTDIGGFSADAIKYYDEKDKEKELKLSSHTVVMYNGRIAEFDLAEITSDFMGTVLAINNDGDRYYDVVFIEEVRSIVFGGITDNAIYDKLTGENISITSIDDVMIIDGQAVIPVNMLNIGTVADIYESKNTSGDKVVRMYLCSNTSEGIVSEIDNENIITLNDDIHLEAASGASIDIGIGSNMKFYLNSFGQYVKFDVIDMPKYAIVLDTAGSIGSGLNVYSGIKLLTQENTIVELRFGDSVYGDGVLLRTREELADGKDSWIGLNSISPDTPVRYRLNSVGKVIMIDTPNPGVSNYNDSLTRLATGSHRFRGKGHVEDEATNTIVCIMAENYLVAKLPQGGNEETYSFTNTIASGDGWKQLDIYTSKSGSFIGDFVLWKNAVNENRDWGHNYLVSKKYTRLNSNGDTEFVVKAVYGGGEQDLVIDEEMYKTDSAFKNKIDTIDIGDVIQVKTNPLGKVNEVHIRYFRSGEASRNGESSALTKYTLYQGGSYVGEVTDREGNVIEITTDTTTFYADLSQVSTVAQCSALSGNKYDIKESISKVQIGVGTKIFASTALTTRPIYFIVVYN